MKSFKIKPLFKYKYDFKIKPIFRLFMTVAVCLVMCACSNNDTDIESEVTHKDVFTKPGSIIDEVGIDTSVADSIEDQTVLDKQLEDNKSSSDSEQVENSVGFDLSNISENAVKNLINELAKENNYTTFDIIEKYEDKMVNQIGYTIIFDNIDYWVITYENGKAYAIKDEYGIYGSSDEPEASEPEASEPEALVENTLKEDEEVIDSEIEAPEEIDEEGYEDEEVLE
ncbi:MAG: hypothetical protein J6A59_12575 [Lachnospiraceae bacterium]|nr:hypothetical protein [Lachnospiraceae bacterium]